MAPLKGKNTIHLLCDGNAVNFAYKGVNGPFVYSVQGALLGAVIKIAQSNHSLSLDKINELSMKNQRLIAEFWIHTFSTNKKSEDDVEESLEKTDPPSRSFFLKKIEEDSRLKFLSNKIIEQGITDPAHDMEHLLRVARWTSYIMHKENNGNNEQTLPLSIAAALMHDYINLPKNHPERALASQITAEAAHQLFLEAGFSKEDATEMATAIRTHSYSRGEIPSTMLGKALQDADRLDALGTLGIFRCISISTQMGSKLFDAADPWSTDREYDDKKFAVDHFFTKLLKLPERMNTEAAKIEANRRANNMIGFLKQLSKEIGVDFPSFAEEILK